MKSLSVAVLLLYASLLCACSTNRAEPLLVDADGDRKINAKTDAASHEAMLLVSLDNGSVIMQRINSNADVCFKRNSDSSTTCLTQGAAVIDPATDTVIGFEMIEAQIDLIASSD